jgi:hypothetical protein
MAKGGRIAMSDGTVLDQMIYRTDAGDIYSLTLGEESSGENTLTGLIVPSPEEEFEICDVEVGYPLGRLRSYIRF